MAEISWQWNTRILPVFTLVAQANSGIGVVLAQPGEVDQVVQHLGQGIVVGRDWRRRATPARETASQTSQPGEKSMSPTESARSSGVGCSGLKRARSATVPQNRASDRARLRRAAAAPARRPAPTPFMAPALVPQTAAMSMPPSSSSRSSTPQVKAPCAPPPWSARLSRGRAVRCRFAHARASAGLYPQTVMPMGRIDFKVSRFASTVHPSDRGLSSRNGPCLVRPLDSAAPASCRGRGREKMGALRWPI